MENRNERVKFILNEVEKGNLKTAYVVVRESILLKVREEVENDRRKSGVNQSD